MELRRFINFDDFIIYAMIPRNIDELIPRGISLHAYNDAYKQMKQ